MKSRDQRPTSGISGALNFLRRLKLWQKFALLGIVVAPAVAVPSYQFYATAQEGIDFALSEERGLVPSLKLIELVQTTQQHRGLTAGVLGGNEALAGARADTEAKKKRLMAEMDELMKDIDNKEISESWKTTKTVFPEIARDINNGTIFAGESFERHTRLIESYMGLLDSIVDYHKLSLDPDAHTYHLIQASLLGLPRLTEPFGQLRGLGTGALAAAEQRTGLETGPQGLDDELRAKLTALTTSGARDLEFVARSMKKVFRESPELAQGALPPALKKAEDETRKMLELAREELVTAGTLTFDSAEFFERLTQGIDQQLALTDAATEALRAQLDDKIANLRQNQLVQTGTIALIILAAALLGFAVVRSVLQPVSHLQSVMEGLRQGDTTLRARLESTDEIGELGRHFDTMVDEREAAAARITEENEALNESIIAILRSVAKTAQGDLTMSAPVREDITGALSDAINSMSESTAKALANVTAASHEVRSASQTGRDTVVETSRGMNDIRGTIQETGKRIKRLGERSQEITGIVKLIDDISERTSVLALNANMQAAMAGEAGRGFRVVADEVQRLAERSKEATNQVSKLVDAIQSETNDTMSTMDHAIGEVVKGGELADRAAEQVTHLDELGELLLQSIQAFTLPEDLLKEAGAGEPADRRAA